MTWTVFFGGGGGIDIDTLCNLKFYFLESQITMSHEDMTMYNFGILRLFYVKKKAVVYFHQKWAPDSRDNQKVVSYGKMNVLGPHL